ncbi:hypothetical protein GCM10017083_01640 [Thalassobaculum fulvum]|uniref:Uncharacterized protein n=1 Tax=Thalassobaculum fulvum TaxID=1633335 RepID=A0A918XNH7_9PROT|nr:hypothetical protein [Thalassobaculum fulvum]GHD39608.1 hypothetical protein GCM10017083_01640 [Thalassobaculum fulvum]
MTILPTADPTTPHAAKPSAASQTVWNGPRTTPDGDLMPGEEPTAAGAALGFGDFLDVINPLQHLPVVGTIYRALTGDTIGEAARMAGGALYGGPLGVIGALANVVVEREAGQDIGGAAMAWLTDEPDAGGDAATALADARQPKTLAAPINAAPVTVAAANASPQAVAARAAAAAGPDATPARTADASPAQAAHPTTDFQGRSADRLDAFIRQANAVRRNNPLAPMHRAEPPTTRPALPGSIDPTRLQATALKPPGIGDPATAGQPAAGGRGGPGTASDGAELALAGGDASSVNQWMLRALDKYEHMRKQESS